MKFAKTVFLVLVLTMVVSPFAQASSLEDRVAALEAKVAQLEQLIRELIDDASNEETGEAPKAPREEWSFSNISHWNISNRETSSHIGYQMQGEVANNSGTDYMMVHFVLTLYGEDGDVIGNNKFTLFNGIRNGQTKPFESGVVYGVKASDIWDFKLEFDRGIEDL